MLQYRKGTRLDMNMLMLIILAMLVVAISTLVIGSGMNDLSEKAILTLMD